MFSAELVGDDACSAEDTDCILSLRQLRGQLQAAEWTADADGDGEVQLEASFHQGSESQVAAGDLAVCKGEGGRYGDFKCNHDPTHRVCATLLDKSGQLEKWGPKGDFWTITGQKAFQWDTQIRGAPNPGRNWCICMWATARLINSVGCDNVHLACNATDVKYIMQKYEDAGTNLKPAHDCLKKKCVDHKALLQEPPTAATPPRKAQAAPATPLDGAPTAATAATA